MESFHVGLRLKQETVGYFNQFIPLWINETNEQQFDLISIFSLKVLKRIFFIGDNIPSDRPKISCIKKWKLCH